MGKKFVRGVVLAAGAAQAAPMGLGGGPAVSGPNAGKCIPVQPGVHVLGPGEAWCITANGSTGLWVFGR